MMSNFRNLSKSVIEFKNSKLKNHFDFKWYLRTLLMISDFILFIPSIFFYIKTFYPNLQNGYRNFIIFLLINNPFYLLMTNSLYYTNLIMVGLMIWSIIALLKNHNIISTILFTLALNMSEQSLFLLFPMGLFIWYNAKISEDKKRTFYLKKTLF